MSFKIRQIRAGGGWRNPLMERPVAPGAGLGDKIERVVKPIAVAFRMDCLDEKDRLKHNSPCAKRRDRANRLGSRLGIGTKKT